MFLTSDGVVMQVDSIFIGTRGGVDILVSRRIEAFFKHLPGIYQTCYRAMNRYCHGLEVKFDPSVIAEDGLKRQLEVLNPGCSWLLCRPGDSCDGGNCELRLNSGKN
ncbi:MAG: hypothetical protein OEZ10_12460 [Gammaproteobacteria bacterium]|nr:hypothetical protein [Gammaproteobacteria bacterium]